MNIQKERWGEGGGWQRKVLKEKPNHTWQGKFIEQERWWTDKELTSVLKPEKKTKCVEFSVPCLRCNRGFRYCCGSLFVHFSYRNSPLCEKTSLYVSVVSQKRKQDEREQGGILFDIYNNYYIVDSTNWHFVRYLGKEAEG